MVERVTRFFPPFLSTRKDRGDHRALIATLQQTIELASSDIAELLEQADFFSSSGKYLDWWGNLLGVPRLPNEDDEMYWKRIAFEVPALHQTKRGLVKAIAQYSPNIREGSIEIFEPHTQLHATSINFRSSGSRTPDHRYWGWGIIDIRTPNQVSSIAQRKLTQYKACGVKIFYSIITSDTIPIRTASLEHRQAITLSFTTQHTHRPLRTSTDGSSSVFGVSFTGTVFHITTTTTFSTTTFTIGDVPPYGRGPWGACPYGSPLTRTAFLGITLKITNTSELYDFTNGYGIGAYGVVPYGSPFAHYHVEAGAFEIVTQEG